jgi:hypothetical protein
MLDVMVSSNSFFTDFSDPEIDAKADGTSSDLPRRHSRFFDRPHGLCTASRRTSSDR